MAKKFLSFLGTNAYVHCRYELNGEESNPVRYVQEALASHLCKDWTKEDKIFVFVTGGENGSFQRNWIIGSFNRSDTIGRDYEQKETGQEEALGLKQRLERLNLQCKAEAVEIQENDVWDIICKFYEAIEERDELFIDITHSFRFIPMIVPAILSFLKTTKQIEIRGIYYGALESLGKPQEIVGMELSQRTVPIKELTAIYEMIEWSEAVNAFLKYVDGEILNKQIETTDRKSEEKLKELREAIEKTDTALKWNNVTELKPIRNKVENIKFDGNNFFVLNKLLPHIGEFVNQWTEDKIENGLLAAKWSWENKRYAQALTFAKEAMQTFFEQFFNVNGKCKKHWINFGIKVALGKATKERYRGKDWTDFVRDIDEIISKLKKIKNSDKVLRNFYKLNGWRNAVNHADNGDRKEMRKKFSRVLESFFETIKK